MPSRAEIGGAFGAIERSRLRPSVVPDSEIIHSPRDRKSSFEEVFRRITKEILGGLFIAEPEWGDALMIEVDVASGTLLDYWKYVIDDIFRAHEASAQGSEEYDGRWIKVDSEEIRLTVKEIEGPVDVTRYGIERRTLSEESELVFDLDEEGRLEEVLNPLCITNRTPDRVVDIGGIGTEHEIKYRHGRIDKIEIVETRSYTAGTIVRTTKLRIPPLI